MTSDETLALNAQRGSREALLALVERYYDLILRYVYRLNNGHLMLAEDLTQDVFLRLHRSLAHYQYPRPFKPWIYTIATNLVRDHWALLDTRRTDNATSDHDDALITLDQPETVFIQQETIERLKFALGQLPELQRVAVLLYYYEDLSQSEIAAILNIPSGTVKSRVFTGLRRLRTILDKP